MRNVVFIGQAPAKPGSKHGVPGTYLLPWLTQIGIDETLVEAYCRFYALIGEFPGSGNNGHLRPTGSQVLRYRPTLIKRIQDFQPEVIVPVGTMAIQAVLPGERLQPLTEVIGRRFDVNPFDCLDASRIIVPLPHPSGRSTWIATHRMFVEQALGVLKEELRVS
jgi:uracil-DNA glycosylase